MKKLLARFLVKKVSSSSIRRYQVISLREGKLCFFGEEKLYIYGLYMAMRSISECASIYQVYYWNFDTTHLNKYDWNNDSIFEYAELR